MDELDNILKEFLVESYENLDQLDRDLVALESDPGNLNTLASIFRTIHTIKGTCGFLGLSKLEAVSHAGESLLGFLREGKISLDSDRTTVLLTMVDAIREILGKIEKTDAEGDKDYSQLIQSIMAAQEDSAETRLADKRQNATLGNSFVDALFPAAASPLPSSSNRDSDGPTLFTRIGGLEAIGAVTKEFYHRVLHDAKLKTYFAKVKMGPFRNNQVACLALALSGKKQKGTAAFWGAHNKLGITEDLFPHVSKHLAAALESQDVGASLQKEILAALSPVAPEREKPAATPETSAPAATGQPEKLEEGNPKSYLPASEENSPNETEQFAADGGSPSGSSIVDSSIRVDVNLLDNLMNLVGELVLARNQILQHATENNTDSGFNATSQRLNLITSELQEGVMRTRMQPIGNIWSKFPRVVRDLALASQKKIRVEMEGKDTELDKTIIEAIKDPLTHLVRNAADHGIEHPESRLAAGKPPEGRLQLRAFHEGGQVNIEITDDGGGIDPEKIKQKALDQGLITPDQVTRMSEREALSLIFLPGFSTAAKVTNISGRGVGMDVVKTNIERIGGTVDVYSTLGQGTTVKMKIPLTLAIIPALVITCGGDRYSIPQVSLLELVRLESDEAKKGIERIHGAPVYRLRGNLLPLVYLSREMELGEGNYEEGVNIVVLQAEDRQFGLVVEGIHDTEEIVVKPLGKQLKHLSIYSGATIMGDGTVALILDVLGLAQRANVVSAATEKSLTETTEAADTQAAAEDRQMLLIFEVGTDGRMAMPLSLVARLEEFPHEDVERSGQQDVVQYRGEIMPLLHLSRAFGFAENGHTGYDLLQVVVYTAEGRSVGLVVNRIIDIVDEAISVQRQSTVEGLLESVVIQGRVTDMLDVEGIIQKFDSGYFASTTETVGA